MSKVNLQWSIRKYCATKFSIENFSIRKIKMKKSFIDVWNEHLMNLKSFLTETDVCTPIEIWDYVKTGNIWNTINTVFQECFPYNLANFNLFHFKLPSQGLSGAVHFIWKQGNTECDNTPEQLKLVESLKSSSKTFHTQVMMKEIQFKLRQLWMVKLQLIIYVIKDLLGDKYASSSQSQTEILGRLKTAILWEKTLLTSGKAMLKNTKVWWILGGDFFFINISLIIFSLVLFFLSFCVLFLLICIILRKNNFVTIFINSVFFCKKFSHGFILTKWVFVCFFLMEAFWWFFLNL